MSEKTLTPDERLAAIEANLKRPRAQPKGPRLPIRALDDRGRALLEAMVHGVDEEKAEELGLDPHRPLPLELAAQAAGLKTKNARFIFSQKVFLAEFSKELAAIRSGHKARAVQVLADIMEDPGNNLAADKAVRVKASTVLLGSDAGENKSSINLNVGVNLTAGVVVRLAPDKIDQLQKNRAALAERSGHVLDLEANREDGA